MSNLEPEPQLLGALVEQQDGEDLIVDHAFHDFGNAVQEGIQVQRGVENIRHFHQ